jgi:GNAT superfamily N-acetyltransferase
MTDQEKKDWLSKCWVTWVEVGFGCRQYMAFHPEYSSPVGIVWCLPGTKETFAISVYSFVLPFYRRRGLRSLLNQYILEHHAGIQTSGATEEGAAWMTAQGYKRDKVRGDWYLKAPKKKKKAAKK